jgi:hypothetical protein
MMPKWIVQTYRGCRDLPHVGPHRGTPVMLAFVGALLIVGMQEGKLLAAIIPAPFLVALYLHDAYRRAEYSDRLSGIERGDQ